MQVPLLHRINSGFKSRVAWIPIRKNNRYIRTFFTKDMYFFEDNTAQL